MYGVQLFRVSKWTFYWAIQYKVFILDPFNRFTWKTLTHFIATLAQNKSKYVYRISTRCNKPFIPWWSTLSWVRSVWTRRVTYLTSSLQWGDYPDHFSIQRLSAQTNRLSGFRNSPFRSRRRGKGSSYSRMQGNSWGSNPGSFGGVKPIGNTTLQHECVSVCVCVCPSFAPKSERAKANPRARRLNTTWAHESCNTR